MNTKLYHLTDRETAVAILRSDGGNHRRTPMKFGPRIPSLKKRIAARTSPALFVWQSLGLKASRGWGWLTNPRRAAYNRVYSRTTFGLRGCAWMLLIPSGALAFWWAMR